MIKRYEDIVLNIHGKAGDEERADYILALCKITQLICQLYQPEQDTKWQKLKEWLEESISVMSDSANYRQKEQLKLVIQKMRELEGEDE